MQNYCDFKSYCGNMEYCEFERKKKEYCKIRNAKYGIWNIAKFCNMRRTYCHMRRRLQKLKPAALWPDLRRTLCATQITLIFASHRIQRATQIAKRYASFPHTTQIIYRSSASRHVPSDPCPTQIGVSSPTQIVISLLVIISSTPFSSLLVTCLVKLSWDF